MAFKKCKDISMEEKGEGKREKTKREILNRNLDRKN